MPPTMLMDNRPVSDEWSRQRRARGEDVIGGFERTRQIAVTRSTVTVESHHVLSIR